MVNYWSQHWKEHYNARNCMRLCVARSTTQANTTAKSGHSTDAATHNSVTSPPLSMTSSALAHNRPPQLYDVVAVATSWRRLEAGSTCCRRLATCCRL